VIIFGSVIVSSRTLHGHLRESTTEFESVVFRKTCCLLGVVLANTNCWGVFAYQSLLYILICTYCRLLATLPPPCVERERRKKECKL
jgi:hypothetical protein